jgi:hypothetical protein
MIDLRDFGYRSRRAFHMDRGVPVGLFFDMAWDPRWFVQKSVLTHPDCPRQIKDYFLANETWYKRFVAYFSGEGHRWEQALKDPHPTVRRCAVRWYESKTITGRVRRFLRENRIWGKRHESRRLQEG